MTWSEALRMLAMLPGDEAEREEAAAEMVAAGQHYERNVDPDANTQARIVFKMAPEEALRRVRAKAWMRRAQSPAIEAPLGVAAAMALRAPRRSLVDRASRAGQQM
jgi:hypothetical protein